LPKNHVIVIFGEKRALQARYTEQIIVPDSDMKTSTAFIIAAICLVVGGLAFLAGGKAAGVALVAPACLYLILALRTRDARTLPDRPGY